MGCPECKSEDTMTRTVSVKTIKTLSARFWQAVEQEEKTDTVIRCLDCGHEWEGEE